MPLNANIWTQLSEEASFLRERIRELPVGSTIVNERLAEEIGAYTFEAPRSLEAITADTARWLRGGTVHVTHPRYFGLFNPSIHEAGIAAEVLAALYNPQLAVASHAPAAALIERAALGFFARKIGWNPDEVAASFTSGGAEANLSALLTALAHRLPESGVGGVAVLSSQPTLYLSSESHHSFVKVARMVGLGTDALRLIPTDEALRMDAGALRYMLEDDLRAGCTPLMLVATAGTTGAGVIDPLGELAEVASAYRLWLHVDAAWGGAALVSPKLRTSLAGLELADSVTWDAHKWLSVPMGAGMFYCRHPEAVNRAFAVSTSYMPSRETTDPYVSSVQWSRRFIGLKVFMTLAELGDAGYARTIEHQAAMGDLLRVRLRDHGWRVVNGTPLPVICFTHPEIEAGSLDTAAILSTVYARNRVWISEVVLGQRVRALRACITSFHTNADDVECLIQELELARSP